MKVNAFTHMSHVRHVYTTSIIFLHTCIYTCMYMYMLMTWFYKNVLPWVGLGTHDTLHSRQSALPACIVDLVLHVCHMYAFTYTSYM